MTTKLLAASLIVAAAATPVLAQEITGAEGQLKYQNVDTPGSDFDVTSLSVGVEGTIAPNFGLGANMRLDTIQDQDDSLFNGTVHAMYMLSPETALGVFYTNENQGDFDAASYGIEGGYATMNGRIDAHYGVVDSSDVSDLDISYGGISFAFDVGSSVTLGLGYDAFTIDDGILLTTGLADFTASDLSVFADYEIADGFSVFAELGQISFSATDGDLSFESDAEDESTYISVGATYTFERGTIFDARGYNSFGR